MHVEELKRSLASAASEKHSTITLALGQITNAVRDWQDSLSESANALRNDLAAEARSWRRELEDQLRSERQATQTSRELLLQERAKDQQETAHLRRTFLLWGMLSALALSSLTTLVSLSLVSILPYKALPFLLRERTEQLATVEATLNETKSSMYAAESRLKELNASILSSQQQLDQLKAQKTADPMYKFIEPLLGSDNKDPTAIYVLAPKNYKTVPDKDGTWIRLR